jgi:CubicO group peptidase (beta-lactamase class C family)
MLELASPESLGLSSKRLQRITHWLDEQVASERVAGAGVMIGRRGRVGYFETTGQADIVTATPFERDTIVRIYSMTKPITTVAAMMLYERGCFQLDDPIAKYLPAFAKTPVWVGANAKLNDTVAQQSLITVRQLMTHTAGFTYSFMRSNVVDACYREQGIDGSDSVMSLAEMVDKLATIPLICQPGTQWNYSVATDVLGRLVEIWSGQTLEEFFDQQILGPLKMRDTGFHVDPGHHSRFASNYSPLSGAEMSNVGRSTVGQLVEQKQTGLKLLDDAKSSRYLEPAQLFSGGGGLTSSMMDYARFCQMLLNRGELDGVRLLGRKTVEYMRLNHLPNHQDMAAMGQPVWSETSYDGIGFGLGFAVVLDPVKAQSLTSAGEHHWGGAASTFFWIDPEEDLFVVFFTQLMPSSTYPIRRELRACVYQSLID